MDNERQMSFSWWWVPAFAAAFWVGRMLWSAAYTQGFQDGLSNTAEMAERHEKLWENPL